ncbi:MAG: hypothetical protein ACKVS9_16635, partial [Phycisphaerae bacterium]
MTKFSAFLRVLGIAVAVAPVAALADDDCDDQVALVTLAPGVSIATFNSQFGTSTISSIAAINVFLVSVPEGTNYGDLELAVESSPLLLDIEQNCDVVDTSPEGGTRTFFFNTFPDAFQNQPAVSIIGVQAAQQLSTGA